MKEAIKNLKPHLPSDLTTRQFIDNFSLFINQYYRIV